MDTEDSFFETEVSSTTSSSSSSSSPRRGRDSFRLGWRLWKSMEGQMGQIGGFGKLPRLLGMPDRQQVRRGLGAHAVVGQDVVGGGHHVLAREYQGLAAPALELEFDVVVL